MSREEAIKVLREFTDERKLSIVKNALETVISAEKESNVRESSKWDLSSIRTWQYIVSDVLTKREGIGNYLDDGGCQKIAKYMQEEWGKKLIPTRDCVIEALRTEYEKGRADAIAELNKDSIKSAWDEEDEHRIKDTIYFLETAKKHYASTVELDACISWLERLKKRLSLENEDVKKCKPTYIPRFHKGDKVINTNNTRLTYDILDIIGGLDYKVKVYVDGKLFASDTRFISCKMMDEWGILYTDNEC